MNFFRRNLPILNSVGVVALVAGIISSLRSDSVAAQPNLSGDWPTYGNGPAHSGYFPGTLNGLTFVLKWKTITPNFKVSQAAVGGGRVFITTGWYYGSMYLMSFNSETGQPLRTNNFGSQFSIN